MRRILFLALGLFLLMTTVSFASGRIFHENVVEGPVTVPTKLDGSSKLAKLASNRSGERLYNELLARTPSGKQPNAPATDPDISWDERKSAYMSYTSRATDIVKVRGSKQTRKVFLVSRKKEAWDEHGSQWNYGKVTLISRGYTGKPANGDSWGARLSGSANRAPQTMAFVSKASNLVKNDRNKKADVFVRRMSTGKLTRIPAGSSDVKQVAISGEGYVRKYQPAVMWTDDSGLWYKAHQTAKPVRLATGNITNPDLTYNGMGFAFERDGFVYAGYARTKKIIKVAQGNGVTVDGGSFCSMGPCGEVRFVSYVRDGRSYTGFVGTQLNRVSDTKGQVVRTDGTTVTEVPGFQAEMARTSTGGPQTLFTYGSGVYAWLLTDFATDRVRQMQAYCPRGEKVTDLQVSHTWNYLAYGCGGKSLHFAYMGPYAPLKK